MKPSIEVKNLSKSYTISHQKEVRSSGAIRSIGNLIKKPLGGGGPGYTKETFWALKDVSFEVKPGEIFGILGKNGSGKSTLLKILSRIIDPTEGQIKIHGRVASLLEVGTGFHPELTGRENIFLNGSMLGLSREEIIKRFNQIVEFSEVERFLDTPVKYYSSGMYVRLAFSVAAHLEPDVLILDEVLSVGDSAFQKKSLNKIMETMRSGCTVLMVSHSADAIRTLCKSGMLLENGQVKSIGKIDKVLVDYKKAQIAQLPATSTILREVIVHYSKIKKSEDLSADSILETEVEFTVIDPIKNCNINFYAEDSAGKIAIHSCTDFFNKSPSFEPGNYKLKVSIPRLSLNAGTYSTWFRFSVTKDIGEYALDTARKEISVIGRSTENSAVIDVPTDWSWSKK